MRVRYYPHYDETGKLHWIADDGQLKKAAPDVHNVITDDIAPTLHPCDHKYYTSKAKFRETTRAHGKIEVGNEYDAFMSLNPTDSRRPVTESLKEAYEYHRTIEGKSEGERREIEHRFFGNED
jgi:hypothetical protein